VRVLVDTHCWLWWLASPSRLSRAARAIMESEEHERFLSAASSWEIVIKHATGRLRLPEAPADYVQSRLLGSGVRPLAIEHAHTLQLAELPSHHRDPFDRILVAQAQIEGLALMTADAQLRPYDVEIIWARDG
jgi:PIN domain nuclease of toxin-antitoxin system